MKKWQFAVLTASVSLLGVLTASSHNDACCNPCETKCCNPCGTIELIGDVLIMRPSTTDLNFVIVDPAQGTQPNGIEHGICPDYQVGFRVGAGWVFDCGQKDVRVLYSHLNTKDHKRFVSPTDGQLIITKGLPDLASNFLSPVTINGVTTLPTARSHVKTDWNAGDLQVAMRKTSGCDCNTWLRGFLGLHYTNLYLKENAHYTTGVLPVETASTLAINDPITKSIRARQTSKTWGVGPRAGAEVRYDIACGFGLSGSLGAALLAGEAEHSTFASSQFSNATTPNLLSDVRHKGHCILFPEFDASLGLNYQKNCGCVDLLVEVGYEFRTYLNSMTRTRFFDDDGAGVSLESANNYNLDGVYVRFVVGF